MTSLNPVQRIGNQITEPLQDLHLKLRKEANATAVSLLTQVGIPSPVSATGLPVPAVRRHAPARDDRDRAGLRARVLLADEPTTGLDVTVQAQILDLLGQLQRDRDMAMVLVTHDLGCRRDAHRRDHRHVRRERRRDGANRRALRAWPDAVHRGTSQVDAPHRQPQPHAAHRHRRPSADLVHLPSGCAFSAALPYAQEQCFVDKPPLVEASPGHIYACWYPLTAADPVRPPEPSEQCRRDRHRGRAAGVGHDRPAPLGRGPARVLPPGQPDGASGRRHHVHHPPGRDTRPRRRVRVRQVHDGRAVIQVEKATSGRIRFGDIELTALSRGDLRTLRTQVQMIFQDPISSLNPAPSSHRHRGRAHGHLEDRLEGGAARAGQRDARPGRHRPLPQRQPPATGALGWAVPADQHRPRPDAPAQAPRV